MTTKYRTAEPIEPMTALTPAGIEASAAIVDLINDVTADLGDGDRIAVLDAVTIACGHLRTAAVQTVAARRSAELLGTVAAAIDSTAGATVDVTQIDSMWDCERCLALKPCPDHDDPVEHPNLNTDKKETTDHA